MVLASGKQVRYLKGSSVWIQGVGWCSDDPSLETREWCEAVYAQLVAEMTYRMAGMKNPRKEIDLVEMDDTFSYKEL